MKSSEGSQENKKRPDFIIPKKKKKEGVNLDISEESVCRQERPWTDQTMNIFARRL